MTKELLACALTGRQLYEEITPEEEAQAKESGLVVIFGASDDLCELRGAINDELDPGEFVICGCKLLPEVQGEDIEALRRHGVFDTVIANRSAGTHVTPCWCDPDSEWNWSYKTAAPHCTFEVLDGTDKYCLGIIMDLKDIAKSLG